MKNTQLRSTGQRRSYAPYGTHLSTPLVLLAFVGERCDTLSGGYLLGNGRRAYSPYLMRFLAPDPFSPFSLGGGNSYAYCQGDSINYVDRNGYSPMTALNWMFGVFRKFIGPLYSLSSASNTIVERSIKAAQGLQLPPAPGVKERVRDVVIFHSGSAMMFQAVPNTLLMEPGADVLVNTVVPVLTAAHGDRVFSQIKSTARRAQQYNLPLIDVAIEAVKEASGINLLLRRGPGIVTPLAQRVINRSASLLEWP